MSTIKIGYKESGNFEFSIKSKKILFGLSVRIKISVFDESFLVFIRRGEDTIIGGRQGTLKVHPVDGYHVKVKYSFISEFSHGNDEVKINIDGIDIQKLPVNFYINQGKCTISQSGDHLTAVFLHKAIDVRVNGEPVNYYKRGILTFARFPFVQDPEITYRVDDQWYIVKTLIDDNKLGDEVATMIMGSQEYSATLFTGLEVNKVYKFKDDCAFYELTEKYSNIAQIATGKKIYPQGSEVKITPSQKINHYAVYRNGRYHPLTIITK